MYNVQESFLPINACSSPAPPSAPPYEIASAAIPAITMIEYLSIDDRVILEFSI